MASATATWDLSQAAFEMGFDLGLGMEASETAVLKGHDLEPVVATACVDTSVIIKAPKQRVALIALPRVAPARARL